MWKHPYSTFLKNASTWKTYHNEKLKTYKKIQASNTRASYPKVATPWYKSQHFKCHKHSQ